MKTIGCLAALCAALLLPALDGRADAKVETDELAPPGQWVACTLSPTGTHAAVLVTKGSGFVVLVDGKEGPAFDQILPLDGRPLTLPKALSTTVRIPVVFSDDGVHHAYFAKKGDEYVVIKDGKETARGKATAKLQGLAFSAGGKHLCYVESDAANSHHMVMDGKPEEPVQDVPKIVFSPDGARYAYVARKPGQPKPSLFVDGQPATYVAEDLQFTPDNKLVCISRVATGDHRLMIDGEMKVRARRLVKVYLPPVGKQILTVMGNDPQVGQVLLVNGKKVPGSECNAIRKIIFSPDGNRYAALCRTQEFTKSLNVTNIREFVLIDGKKGQVYQAIRDSADSSQDMQRRLWLNGGFAGPDVTPHNAPGFTADSSKFIYMAGVPPQEFVVVDDQPSEPFPQGRIRDPLVNGKHIAFVCIEDSQATIVVQGKKQELPGFFHSFSLSPDGTRYAYGRAYLNVDGVDQPITVSNPANYLFSPDSKHIAVVGQIPNASKRGLFVNGQLAVPDAAPVNRPIFTPDSKHLMWLGTRSGPAASNGETAVLMVDGRAAIQFKELINAKENWAMSKEGVLTFVARSGDSLKRYRITPPLDTSITSMASGKI